MWSWRLPVFCQQRQLPFQGPPCYHLAGSGSPETERTLGKAWLLLVGWDLNIKLKCGNSIPLPLLPSSLLSPFFLLPCPPSFHSPYAMLGGRFSLSGIVLEIGIQAEETLAVPWVQPSSLPPGFSHLSQYSLPLSPSTCLHTFSCSIPIHPQSTCKIYFIFPCPGRFMCPYLETSVLFSLSGAVDCSMIILYILLCIWNPFTPTGSPQSALT